MATHFGGTYDDIGAVSVLLQQLELSKVELILACISDQQVVTLWYLWPNIVITLNLNLSHPLKSRLIWNRDELRRIGYALQAIAHHHREPTSSSLHFCHLLLA